jgi:hypothetical protein
MRKRLPPQRPAPDGREDRLRMRLGALGRPLARLLLWQLPLRLGIQPSQLRPIERMAAQQDLHAYLPGEYERRIGAFLARYVAGE